MSYPVQKPTQHTSPAATTSSIHEYTILFTHDLKRKSKRWQDGRLRHHVFNNRIMVYDDGGASIGDAHLPSSSTLEEGDEINLDRGGAIVQICERVGEKEVDLRDLVDKRMREVEKRRREAAEKPGRGSAAAVQRSQQQRPLSSIMQTPARIGRAAIPKESPYEQRLQKEAAEGGETPPPAKRRKRSVSPPSKLGHARALFGTQLTLSARPTSSWSQRSQVLRDRTNVVASRAEEEEDVVMLEKGSQSQDSESGRGRSGLTKGSLPASSPTGGDDQAEERMVRPTKSVKSATGSRVHGLPSLLSSVRKTQADDGRVDTDRRIHKQTSAVMTVESSNEDGTASKSINAPQPGQVGSSSRRAATNRKQKESKKKTVDRAEPQLEDSQPATENENALPPRASSKKTKSPSAAETSSNPPQRKPETGRRETTERTKRRDDEPRTELRIKSRKKRGLLMLSEKPSASEEQTEAVAKPVSTPVSIPAEKSMQAFEDWLSGSLPIEATGNELDESQPQYLSSAAEKEPVEVAQTEPSEPTSHISSLPDQPIPKTAATAEAITKTLNPAIEASKIPCSEVASSSVAPRTLNGPDSSPDQNALELHGVSDNSESEPQARPTRRSKQREPSPDLSDDDDPYKLPCGVSDESDSDDWDGPPPPVKPAARKQPQRNQPEQPRKAAEKPKASKGPRMSRINKNCKSKEIFGFTVPGSGPVVPGSLASTASLVGWGTAPNSVIAATTEEPPEQEKKNTSKKSNKANEDDGRAKPARVVNPATRGRKAASKADAAGRAPETSVPFDSVSTSAAPVVAVAKPEPPKETNALPGFSKANGGAWSRHAEDLLGMVRPKRVSGR